MKQGESFLVFAAAGGILGVAGPALAGPPQVGTPRAHVAWHSPFGQGGADAIPSSDNFDSYATGAFPCAAVAPGCTGPNGWALWGVAETTTAGASGPNDGAIVNSGASSAPNALRLAPAVDIVQTGNVTTGTWDIRLKTFVPAGITTPASAQAYLIVLNTYSPPTFANNYWSIQVKLDPISNQVIDSNNNTPHGALITNLWVDLRVRIDLDADTYTVFYNNAQIWGPINYSGAFLPGGAHAIQCIDLFSDDATGVLYDDFSIAQVSNLTCYANCDGSTGNPFLTINDFVCFQAKFAAGDSYANCDNSTINPILTVNDFICFQGKFAAGCSAP